MTFLTYFNELILLNFKQPKTIVDHIANVCLSVTIKQSLKNFEILKVSKII